MRDGGRNASSLLRPGENCWRTAQADRIALLVDGEAYFKAFVAAAQLARSSILILAWDFNSRTCLNCGAENGEGLLLLGDFLNSLARRRRRLEVRVLIWDYPTIFDTGRELSPIYGLSWKPHRRVRVRYDNTHPVAGSHHQKVVVIDDRVAFCGGLDLTSRRWDTCDHKPGDERRKAEDTPYPPFHDLMMMVDGEAARALGTLARDRWQLATGRELKPARPGPDAWPPDLEPQLTDAMVAISRTVPPRNLHQPVREIEALFLDMIAAARHYILIENQYLTAHNIGEALAARLDEPDGPEIVVVLRLLSHGWLEEITMQNLRRNLIDRLGSPQRALKRLENTGVSETLASLASIADPERPVTMENLVAQFSPRTEIRMRGVRWLKLTIAIVVLAALTALWQFTPLADVITPGRVTHWAREFAGTVWAPLIVLAAYTPAALVMFPRPLITLFAAVAFGPWLGFGYAMSGILISALVTYVIGMRVDRSTVRRLGGPKLNRIIAVLRERGIVALTAVRLVPLAPFAVVGVVAGAIRVKLLDFMLATAFGMLPGTLAATVFGDQLEVALGDPGEVNLWLVAAVAMALGIAMLLVRRWLLTTELHGESTRA